MIRHLATEEQNQKYGLSEDSDYSERVKFAVRKALSIEPKRFFDLVRATKGAYPTVVRDLLNDAKQHVFSENVPLLKWANKGPANPIDWRSLLLGIEGNPTLSSWYFTPAACERVALLRSWSEQKLAFLGTPRLYEWFAAHKLGIQRALLDLDPLVVATLSQLASDNDVVAEYDTATDLPSDFSGRYDCVFVDPPWYPADYQTWLSRALMLAPDGYLFLSLYPELVRPSAVAERDVLLQKLSECTDLQLVCTSFLEYEVPSFELAQLHRAGLEDVVPWKLSDLVIARIKKSTDGQTFTPAKHENWTEIDIGKLRIFVNTERQIRAADQLLSPLSSGSIFLASPSRREPFFNRVNVMTSRGHGLVSSDPLRLIGVLSSLKEALMRGDDVSRAWKQRSVDSHSASLLDRMLKEE